MQDFTGKGLQRPSTLSLRSRRMLCCKNPLMTLLQQLQLLEVAVAWFKKPSNTDFQPVACSSIAYLIVECSSRIFHRLFQSVACGSIAYLIDGCSSRIFHRLLSPVACCSIAYLIVECSNRIFHRLFHTAVQTFALLHVAAPICRGCVTACI